MHLDWHACDVESMGKQSAFPQQSLVPCCEFNLGDGKRVTQVQRPVHVGEGETSEPLRILFLDLSGCQAFELLLCRRIDVEYLLLFPLGLILFL